MKIIPVIDILNNRVVHAIRGKRKEYKPIQSILTRSTEPLEVAQAFKNNGFGELYIADIDAIIECSTSFQLLKQIVERTGLELMVDAGITNLERAQTLLDSGVSKLIIGTETLTKAEFVADAVKLFGKNRVVVSLDLKGDKVLVQPGFDECTDVMCLLRKFQEIGVSKLIVLDLTQVGSGEGVNISFLKQVLETFEFEVYVGGGVRDVHDLVELNNIGVSRVLIASALHNGKITTQQLKAEGFL
jgi:phosphoribosylformimino-5-aminoimidazole carboxamide ribotide isomerase